jgi:phenylpropionate dioxygenase-like ring-hydroxylating dioxygenase large terminal subunit
LSVIGQQADPLLDDAALVERVLDHIDHGTTDLADRTWREPAANYTSQARLSEELELLRCLPVPFCPSVALTEGGSYVARDAAGVPVVAVRDAAGIVRVFRNACRHRGTQLVDGHGCAPSLVCPYHGWVYRLDGGLRHVPHDYGFPELDRSTRGLCAVHAVEHAGLVFVSQTEPFELNSIQSLPDVLSPNLELVRTAESHVDANWKVLVEGFLEGYHLKATHRQTFFPFGYDNVTVIECVDRYSRVTFPFRRIETLRDVPADARVLDGMATTVHHLFPNVIVASLSHHMTMVVLEPDTCSRTRLVAYQLAEPRSSTGERSTAAARDMAFVDNGAAEDRAIACAVTRGLASGANEFLEFGLFEGAITQFHRQLHDLLGDGR